MAKKNKSDINVLILLMTSLKALKIKNLLQESSLFSLSSLILNLAWNLKANIWRRYKIDVRDLKNSISSFKIRLGIVQNALVLILLFSSNAFAQKANKINNITIFSEDGMAYPLVKIVRLYSIDHNSTISTNFNNSLESLKNIEDGEPVDVFIVSHPDWIESLKQKGLVDVYNISNIAKDKLVLITSSKNKKINFEKINQLFDIKSILTEINREQIPIIVDSKDTSLGKYTKEILKNLGFDNQKIYYKISEDRVSIADFIEQNAEYCGIVLASAVKNYNNIKVLKEVDDKDIYYQALVIGGSNMNQAREFINFLKSDSAKDLFVENGFEVE